ncbi:hypothetical protein B0H14DRAFT_358721 [Mycena olivaceomarginata]|nr:hypothetical protein B0H14DRAFT_358721 [Mycena olivaceomarginata]
MLNPSWPQDMLGLKCGSTSRPQICIGRKPPETGLMTFQVQRGSDCPLENCVWILEMGSTRAYHDDMVKIPQIQKMHAQSILASRYVNFKMQQHFEAAELYWEDTTGNNVGELPGTAWIRLSTGKLCLDIGDGVKLYWEVRSDLRWHYTLHEFPSFKVTEDELHAKLLRVLKFDDFYAMFEFSPLQYFGHYLPSSTESITLPSIRISGDWADFKSDQLLANPFPNHVTLNEIYMQPWQSYPSQNEGIPTGWTRVEHQDNPNLDSRHLSAYCRIEHPAASHVEKWWLSQQAYVHKHLQGVIVADVPLRLITGIHFYYILNHQLDGFTLRGTFMTHAPSDKVYLFLFPPQVKILDNQLTVINLPDAEKYYWAFDPAGLDQLTHEIAEDIGLPTPEFRIEPWGLLLEEEETNLIHEFHAAKGFDPESQDVAVVVRCPLVDIEAMKRSTQELTEQHSMIDPDTDSDEVEDEIYYSLALC